MKSSKIVSKDIVIITRLLKHLFRVNWFVAINLYITTFNEMRKNNGIQYTIKYYKAVRLHITRFICGKPLLSNLSNVSVDKDGWPTKFACLKSMINHDFKTNIRPLLTLLSYTRSVKPTPEESVNIKPDYDSIDLPFKGKFYTIPGSFIETWVRINHLKLPVPKYSELDHYISTKSSPNGPATLSATWSSSILPDRIKDYINSFIGEYKDNFWSSSKIDHNIISKSLNSKTKWFKNCGSLAVRDDPELKKRVIAMVDYSSQFVLRKIHNDLMGLLKKLKNDRTFTQNPFHDWDVSRPYERFHSLDLSSATDRFPIHLQKKLLTYIYGSASFADNWAKLLVDRDYMDSQGNPHRYSVGQPMGAYSSWAAFTLTHHLVVSWAACKARELDFNDYIILGDDIVIKNNKVSQRYITIMTKLGVSISQAKTHISYDTYEFAKRWIKAGVEISGISLKGILANLENIYICYNTIQEYLQRGSSISKSTIHVICEVFKRIPYTVGDNTYVSSYRSIRGQLRDFDAAMRYSKGLMTNDELRSYLQINSHENFITPGEKLIPMFMRGLFSKVMHDDIYDASVNLQNQLQEYQKSVKGLFKSWDKTFHNSPTVLGYRNHMMDLEEKLSRAGVCDDVSIMDQILAIRFQKIDQVVSLKRCSSEKFNSMASTWRKMMKLLKEDPETYDETYCEIAELLNDLFPIINPYYDGPPMLSSWTSVLNIAIDTSINIYKVINANRSPEPNLSFNRKQFMRLLVAFEGSPELDAYCDWLEKHKKAIIND